MTSKKQFICEPLEDLTRQLLFAPPRKRIDQIHNTEQLHDDIEHDVNYPLDFLTYRITGYPPESTGVTVLVGAAVLPDLRWLIDALSRTVHVPEDPEDPVESIRELSRRLQVSSKTIERYRRIGLRWRWVRPTDGRRRIICFSRSGVERFLQRYGQRVQRASNFTQMDQADRTRLIDAARAEARTSGASLHRVARRLADQSGRAVETIRLLLEHHDRVQPDQAIFPGRPDPLTTRQKDIIARALAMGVAVEKIVFRYGRTRSTIYRAARERRAVRLRRTRPTAVVTEDFDHEDADELYPPIDESTLTATGNAAAIGNMAENLPLPLRHAYGRSGPDPTTLRDALIRFNYVKHRAGRMCESLDRYEPRAKELACIEAYLGEATRLRRGLITAQLHLVLAVATQHLVDKSDTATAHLAELLASGNDVLADAVDNFDWTQRQTFEAYLRWRLMRRFAAQPAAPDRAQKRLDDEAITRLVRGSLYRLGVLA